MLIQTQLQTQDVWCGGARCGASHDIKMKVLQVIGGISPRYGGSKALLGMCRQLRVLGVDTDIVATNTDGDGVLPRPLERAVEVQGAIVYHFSSPMLSKYAFSPALSRWVAGRIKNYDLLHFHGIFLHGFVSTIPKARRLSVPYIVRPMGQLAEWSMSQGRLRKLIYWWLLGRRFLNGAAAIHYTADAEREEAEHFGIRAPGVVIPLGLEESDLSLPRPMAFRERHPQIDGRKIVLFMSRLHPVKGLDLVIEAVKSLSGDRDDFVLVIAGEGDKAYEEKMRDMVRSFGLSGRTIFAGFVDGAEKRALLADSDVFVLPSYQENFGMAIVEAMAAGLPVVISEHVNIHREIAAVDAGIITSSISAQVAAGLKRLLDDVCLRATMGAQAKKLVEEKYHWCAIGPRLVDLYQSVVRWRGTCQLAYKNRD